LPRKGGKKDERAGGQPPVAGLYAPPPPQGGWVGNLGGSPAANRRIAGEPA
jgi:hypothetical protein